MFIATIRGITVTQDPDTWRIHWTGNMAVDADGANGQAGGPFAYRYPDNDGLDTLADAGWPFYGWRNVLFDDGSGHPLRDEHGNAYSKTAYIWHNATVAMRSVDAYSVPYVVVNPHVRTNSCGVVLGCQAQATYKGKTVQAVVADVSGAKDIGEGSIALARELGIDDNPRTGGVQHGVLFELFPNKPAEILGVKYNLIPA